MQSLKNFIFTLLVATLFLQINVLATESLEFTQRDIVSDQKMFVTDYDQDYFTISSVEFTKLSDGDISNKGLNEKSIGSELGSIVMEIDKLIALGKKIWAIVEAGKPVISATFDPISVIPNLEDPDTAFSEMSGWSMPETKKYKVVYENAYGMEVIRFEFMAIFQHSGKHNGKGQYLTGINIIPTNISVAWGYNFFAKSELIAITNMGSMDDPIAGATINLNYVTKTPIKESNTNVVFYIAGDGRILKL